MDTDSNLPPPPTLPATRHDGWTGDKMAVFLETLADTAVVAEACEEARMERRLHVRSMAPWLMSAMGRKRTLAVGKGG